MANHKHKANYKASRSCGLCKPHKRLGNSQERTKHKYRVTGDIMDNKPEGAPAEPKVPVYADPQAV